MMFTLDNMPRIPQWVFSLNLTWTCIFMSQHRFVSGIKVMRLDADDFDEIERIGNA